MFGLYYRALMASELPDTIDCRQLAAGDGRITGTLAGRRLRRVATPYRVAGALEATVTLAPRAAGGYTLSGRLEVPLEAQCQRCLEWMAWPVTATLELLALERAPNEAESEADCVELIDGRLPLAEVLEDELLLSCAFAPTHAEPGCEGATPTAAARLPEERRRPFANLDQLLKGRDDE